MGRLTLACTAVQLCKAHRRASLCSSHLLFTFMKNRIWEDGEGLSWSTITELLGEDENVRSRLKDLTLDLTDNLFEKLVEHRELEQKLNKAKSEIDFLKGNLGSCVLFGQRRLGYEPELHFIHDDEKKFVKVSVANGQILVSETVITS